MGDVTNLQRRALDALGRVVGDTTSTAVTALLILHGFDPNSAAVHGAVAGSISEEVFSTVTSLQKRRLQRFADTAEVESEALTFDELVTEALHDEAKLNLLLVTSEAASRAADDWKVDTLARVFVSGIHGDDTVDTANVIAEVVRQLQPMHLEVMRRLGDEVTHPLAQPPLQVYTTLHLSRHAAGDYFGSPPGLDLSSVIDSLLATLQSLGIVTTVEAMDPRRGTDQAARLLNVGWALTPFGATVAAFLESRVRHD